MIQNGTKIIFEKDKGLEETVPTGSTKFVCNGIQIDIVDSKLVITQKDIINGKFQMNLSYDYEILGSDIKGQFVYTNATPKKTSSSESGGTVDDSASSDQLLTQDKTLVGAINEIYSKLESATLDDIKSIM